VRDMVRWALVGPIVGFLRLADEFPRAELDGVPEPWNSYLSQVREHFERWAAHLPRPAAFDDIDPVQAAEELRITLRHLMWDPAESDRYLDDLTASGQLPLSAPSATLGALAHVLRSRGMDDGRIGAIIGHAPETP
jgi:AcrR family transcriptional regulator